MTSVRDIWGAVTIVAAFLCFLLMALLCVVIESWAFEMMWRVASLLIEHPSYVFISACTRVACMAGLVVAVYSVTTRLVKSKLWPWEE